MYRTFCFLLLAGVLLLPFCPAAAQGNTAFGPTDLFAFPAGLPLDIRVIENVADGPVIVQQLTYASPYGGRVPATLVRPEVKNRNPAVLFQHWGQGDRTEFLDEAKDLARQNVVSLLIDAPWLRPENAARHMFHDNEPLYRQGVTDLLQGLEVLAAQPWVDTSRMAFVGHSYGAHVGAIVGARSARVKALVLMAGTPSASSMMQESPHPYWQRLRDSIPDEFNRNVARMAPLDAALFIPDVHGPVFHQFATRDDFITYAMARRYIDLTPGPVVFRFYDADHGLNAQARIDRQRFLLQVFGIRAGSAAFDQSRLPGYFATSLPLAYPQPQPEQYQLLADQTYRQVSDQTYRYDLYRPASGGKNLPVVVLVHGQMHPLLIRNAKNWPVNQQLAQVLAARGYAVVVPQLGATATGPQPQQQNANLGLVTDNLTGLLAHLRDNAARLGLNPRKTGLWTTSAAGTYGLGLALGELSDQVACVVALYPQLDEAPLRAAQPPLPQPLLARVSPVAQLGKRNGKVKPVLLVRAGRDAPQLLQATDAFAAEATRLKAPLTLVRYDEGHHGFELTDDTDQTRAVLDQAFRFLDQQLKR